MYVARVRNYVGLDVISQGLTRACPGESSSSKVGLKQWRNLIGGALLGRLKLVLPSHDDRR